MGIKKLMDTIEEEAPDAIQKRRKKFYLGKKIAVDSSILLHQFLIQIRLQEDNRSRVLTNKNGKITSHIQGFLIRVANFAENGILPIFVFDGKPSEHKSSEIRKRQNLKKLAQEEINVLEQRLKDNSISKIEELDVLDRITSLEKRTVSVSDEQTEDIKKLLGLLGIPYIQAPEEADSQCAYLIKNGLVDYVASEDMDFLTHGCHTLLRGFTELKDEITEINLEKVLDGFEMNMAQFIDFCILCGCDYCEKIPGVGPKTAMKHIKNYENIETVIKSNNFKVLPDVDYDSVRKLFISPNIDEIRKEHIKLGKIKEKELLHYLVEENDFNIINVKSNIDKIKKLWINYAPTKTLADFVKKSKS